MSKPRARLKQSEAGSHLKEIMMTDIPTIAQGYIDLWNERTPSRRRARPGDGFPSASIPF